MIDLNKMATIIAALVLTLLLGGCAGLRGQAGGVGADTTAELPTYQMQETAGETNNIAVETPDDTSRSFNFSAAELFSGALVYGADLHASSPAIVTFVSPGCPESVDQGPGLATAAEANEDITYVFIHTGGDLAAYETFVDQADLYQQNVIHIDDTDLALTNRFNIKVTPTSILVNNEGSARLSVGSLDHEGLRDAADLVRRTSDSITG